jgi:hypothetical protein
MSTYVMSIERRYARYCAWYWSQGYEPAGRETWLRTVGSIAN